VAVALIEAKAEHLPPTHGLEQGKSYAAARRLNVPFVFASNGHLFVEYDRFTGLTSTPQTLNAFPTPDDLRSRNEQHLGIRLGDAISRPLLARYTGGEATRRYYQDAAIRAVLEKLAWGEKRALLSLATGAGKTFIAVTSCAASPTPGSSPARSSSATATTCANRRRARSRRSLALTPPPSPKATRRRTRGCWSPPTRRWMWTPTTRMLISYWRTIPRTTSATS
jgi:hypothetical protein